MSDHEELDNCVDPTRELTGARVFYRSHPRQKLQFVKATEDRPQPAAAPTRDAASQYEAIVLKHLQQAPEGESSQDLAGDDGPAIDKSSLAHQVGLEHSHPPSHLDRSRTGFKYLASYGWDADARLGLGPGGEGVRAPLKAVKKSNTSGLGLELAKKQNVPEKTQLLDAGKVRKQYATQQKRDAKLREMIYGDDKLERYLGENANTGT